MKMITTIILLALLHFQLQGQCNGHIDLCTKRYNEVSVVMTHNAYNYAGDFQLPNQNFNISQQLSDGVRGLMIDVHKNEGEIVVMHNYSFLGTQPFSDVLDEIKTFLDQNPNEIISIVFESYITATEMETALTSANLMPYLDQQTLGDPWPTLQTMIDNGQRLVAFYESNDAELGQDWYHYAWDFISDTDFSISDQSEFNCDLNRGPSDSDLYLINHFITSGVGTGDEQAAEMANSNPFLIDRANQCQQETGKFPNFIGIDFYEKGDAFEAVEILNGLISTTKDLPRLNPTISPNPFTETAVMEFGEVLGPKAEVNIYNSLGQKVRETKANSKSSLQLTRGNLPKGLYFFTVKDGQELLGTGRFVIL